MTDQSSLIRTSRTSLRERAAAPHHCSDFCTQQGSHEVDCSCF